MYRFLGYGPAVQPQSRPPAATPAAGGAQDDGERRVAPRRTDKKLSRIVYNAHALSRILGVDRATQLLLRAGFSVPETEAILREKLDRRRRANRQHQARHNDAE